MTELVTQFYVDFFIIILMNFNFLRNYSEVEYAISILILGFLLEPILRFFMKFNILYPWNTITLTLENVQVFQKKPLYVCKYNVENVTGILF